MNIVSNHNRLLRGAPVYTAGGDMWTSGLEYEDGKITGYSGSAFGPDCPCDSAAIVDSAFDKSTAWVEEQNYLTAVTLVLLKVQNFLNARRNVPPLFVLFTV